MKVLPVRNTAGTQKYEQNRILKYFKYRQYSRLSNPQILQLQQYSRVSNPKIQRVWQYSQYDGISKCYEYWQYPAVHKGQILRVHEVPEVFSLEKTSLPAGTRSICGRCATSVGVSNRCCTSAIEGRLVNHCEELVANINHCVGCFLPVQCMCLDPER